MSGGRSGRGHDSAQIRHERKGDYEWFGSASAGSEARRGGSLGHEDFVGLQADFLAAPTDAAGLIDELAWMNPLVV